MPSDKMMIGAGSALGSMIDRIEEDAIVEEIKKDNDIVGKVSEMFEKHNAGKERLPSNIGESQSRGFKHSVYVVNDPERSMIADDRSPIIKPEQNIAASTKRVCDIPNDILVAMLYGDIIIAMRNEWVTVDESFKSLEEKPITHKIDDKNIFLVFREMAFDISDIELIKMYTTSIQKLMYSKNSFLENSMSFIVDKVKKVLEEV